MNIKYYTIKPGALLLSKNYNWVQKGIAYLRKRELPFNHATLFADESQLLKIRDTHTSVVVEPKKLYSKKELKQLVSLVYTTTEDIEVTWVTADNKTNDNLFAIVNAIRPNTFKDKEANLNAFIDSKYYNTIKLANDNIWNEYIY